MYYRIKVEVVVMNHLLLMVIMAIVFFTTIIFCYCATAANAQIRSEFKFVSVKMDINHFLARFRGRASYPCKCTRSLVPFLSISGIKHISCHWGWCWVALFCRASVAATYSQIFSLNLATRHQLFASLSDAWFLYILHWMEVGGKHAC